MDTEDKPEPKKQQCYLSCPVCPGKLTPEDLKCPNCNHPRCTSCSE